MRTRADAEGVDRSAGAFRPRLWAPLQRYLPDSHRALQGGSVRDFSRLRGLGEPWRIFGRFAQDCVYLDIETTGLSPEPDQTTKVMRNAGRPY